MYSQALRMTHSSSTCVCVCVCGYNRRMNAANTIRSLASSLHNLAHFGGCRLLLLFAVIFVLFIRSRLSLNPYPIIWPCAPTTECLRREAQAVAWSSSFMVGSLFVVHTDCYGIYYYINFDSCVWKKTPNVFLLLHFAICECVVLLFAAVATTAAAISHNQRTHRTQKKNKIQII